ncbi:MAG TPA: tetratricopeptide repeat protein [Thermoanaerobaculia bacterium]|nr:tetratricopeptide repeat protein [Thermoanaerobaculia bacterium]
MRSTSALLAVLLALLGSAELLAAEANPALRELWPQITAASESGDTKNRDEKVGELFKIGHALGIQRFPLYARSAASLALQAEQDNREEVAGWAIETARRLDPLLPDVELTAADIAWSRDDYAGALRFLTSGVKLIVQNYRSSVLTRSNLTFAFVLAAAAGTLALSIVLFLRYRRIAFHDLREMLSSRFHIGVGTVLAVALLFLPIFIWLGPIWLIAFWLALFFSYANTTEKVLSSILLLLLAATPTVLDWTSYRATVVDSPVVEGSIANIQRIYDPEVIRRLREVLQVVPDEPRIHLLVANLELQHGNDDQAWFHYQKAVELNPRLAGAHLNLGNLHFLVNNDLTAAALAYEKAAAADPTMAIADYNRSVASGELYKFTEQGSFLEQARRKNRSLVERLLASPPQQKVVQYRLPISEAVAASDQISRAGVAREIYGSYATFDFAKSIRNPLTAGSLLALVLAAGLWLARRRSGFAGECIKCGRTFCHRCKSAHESATYCTQCIHIYLKRDGVSLDTKRAKLGEVQKHQTTTLRRRKIMTTFLPGSAQILAGSSVRGVMILLAFLLLLSIALTVGRLAPIASPAETMKLALRVIAGTLALLLWLVASIPVYRESLSS